MVASDVLADENLVGRIVGHLSAPEVSALRTVSRTFDRVCRAVHLEKQRRALSMIQRYIDLYLRAVQPFCVQDHYPTRRECIAANRLLVHIVNSIYLIDWSAYVHFPDIMDSFLLCAASFFWIVKFVRPTERREYFRAFERVRPYMYLTDARSIPAVSVLKTIARIKGVKRASTLRRSRLERLLTRPEGERYYHRAFEQHRAALEHDLNLTPPLPPSSEEV